MLTKSIINILLNVIVFHRARDFPGQFFGPRCNRKKLIILGRCIVERMPGKDRRVYPDDVTEPTYKRAIFYYYERRYIAGTYALA